MNDLYITGITNVLKKSSDCGLTTCGLSATFRRDQYLMPNNEYELMRIAKIIRDLPLQKKQPE